MSGDPWSMARSAWSLRMTKAANVGDLQNVDAGLTARAGSRGGRKLTWGRHRAQLLVVSSDTNSERGRLRLRFAAAFLFRGNVRHLIVGTVSAHRVSRAAPEPQSLNKRVYTTTLLATPLTKDSTVKILEWLLRRGRQGGSKYNSRIVPRLSQEHS